MKSIYFEFFFEKLIYLLILISSVSFFLKKKEIFVRLVSGILIVTSIFFIFNSLFKKYTLNEALQIINDVTELDNMFISDIRLTRNPSVEYKTLNKNILIKDSIETGKIIDLLVYNKSTLINHPNIIKEYNLLIQSEKGLITYRICETSNKGILFKLLSKDRFIIGYYKNNYLGNYLKELYEKK
ncbi:hypothetical protein [Leptobacterium sp. I13]|uniref:hypothetical protein n=1 Tax=Leptobacterium meishanense TaxID=3128904 RepID=UPI0030EE2C84